MHELNNSTMKKGEDPGVYMGKLRQLRDELEAIGELVSEARRTAVVLKCTVILMLSTR